MGIEPYFDLFCYLFLVKPQPSKNDMYDVGGAKIQLRKGMEKKYIPYKFSTSLSRWRERWFYILKFGLKLNILSVILKFNKRESCMYLLHASFISCNLWYATCMWNE
jgi:hypothetical protein